jgi:hypothetical protein
VGLLKNPHLLQPCKYVSRLKVGCHRKEPDLDWTTGPLA